MSSERIGQPQMRRSLFWRLWLRSLTVKRTQAALAIFSVLVGATVASMLLNLYGDARRKMTQEFRAYGPNIVLAPSTSAEPPGQLMPQDTSRRVTHSRMGNSEVVGSEAVNGVMDEGVLNRLAPFVQRGNGFAAVPVLYVVTRVKKAPAQADLAPSRSADSENAVAAGSDFNALRHLYPSWRIQGIENFPNVPSCVVGAHIASRLNLGLGEAIELEMIANGGAKNEPARESFRISAILSTGTSEDDQIFVPLATLQRMGGLTGEISLVELSVSGESAEVESAVTKLRQTLQDLPGVEVRPIRQIIYSAGKVLDTIRWVMFSLTGLILIIIALCVTATMTAIVLERRKDVAVMKSLGASDNLVVQLFLSEGATLGLIGGVAGFGLGLGLAHEMARHLFNVSLSLTWWTFPMVCLASMMLAVLATMFPIEIVHGIQPARVLRGE